MAQPTLLVRSFSVIPFFALALLCARVFQLNSTALPPWLDEAVKRGTVEWRDGSFQLFSSFYRMPALDELWRIINIVFTPSTFGYDPVSSWQMFSFLADAGVVYAIWVFEASREANIRTSAYCPAIFGQVFQVIGGAIISPLYYVGYMFTVPRANALTAETRRMDISHVRTLLLTLLLVYYVPFLGAFLAPSLETRHTWTWLWQMFPVWISISQMLLSRIFPSTHSQPGFDLDLKFSRLTITVIAAFSGGTWLYTMFNAPYSMRQIFIPEVFVSRDALTALRTMLQFDHLIFFTCAILWLVYLGSDLQHAGMMQVGLPTWAILILVGSMAIGPGAAIGVGWLVREELLARRPVQLQKKD